MDFLNDFLLPPAKTTHADAVDKLFGFVNFVSVILVVGITIAVIYFVVKYYRKSENEVTPIIRQNVPLEVTWTIVPLFLVFIVFGWGFKGFMELTQVPENAYEIQVTAQRWSWTFEYPNGATTTNNLHVPANRPVKLIMKSRANDVIHSLFVPAYRVKKDVLPNQYTQLWFNVKEPGKSDLFCAEYCGTGHSDMTGTVIAHSKEDYKDWLAQAGAASAEDLPPVERGKKLFTQNACQTCHSLDGTRKTGPTIKGLFGSKEKLKSGKTITVDENYLRESILNPNAKIAAGYAAVMPSFKGQLSDDQIDALIEYIKAQK